MRKVYLCPLWVGQLVRPKLSGQVEKFARRIPIRNGLGMTLEKTHQQIVPVLVYVSLAEPQKGLSV